MVSLRNFFLLLQKGGPFGLWKLSYRAIKILDFNFKTCYIFWGSKLYQYVNKIDSKWHSIVSLLICFFRLKTGSSNSSKSAVSQNITTTSSVRFSGVDHISSSTGIGVATTTTTTANSSSRIVTIVSKIYF